MPSNRSKARPPLAPDHKAALAAGRAEARIVREYLLALRDHQPSPGRKRTHESVRRRLDAVKREIAAPGERPEDPVEMLER